MGKGRKGLLQGCENPLQTVREDVPDREVDFKWVQQMASDLVDNNPEIFDKSIPKTRWKRFFTEYGCSGVLYKSFARANISITTHYAKRRETPGYKEIFEEFQNQIIDKLEDIAVYAALEGKDLAHVRWMLQRLNPEKWGDRVSIDAKHQFSLENMTSEELIALIKRGER